MSDNYGGQRSGDNYVDKDGNIHQFRSDAEAANRGGNAMNDAAANVGGRIIGSIIAPIILMVVCFKLVSGLIQQYGFYFWPVVVIYIAISACAALKSGKAFLIIGAIVALSVGSCVIGKTVYYPNVVEPSPYSADYLTSDAALHAGRNGKGRELAQIASGEKVTVNGVSRDRAEFNITTQDGTKGWIPAAVFPADANMPRDRLWDIARNGMPLIGRNSPQSDFYRKFAANGRKDRDWGNAEGTVFNNYFAEGSSGLSARGMELARAVHQPFTVKWREKNRRDDKESGEIEAELSYVVYTPEVTLIIISFTESTAQGWDYYSFTADGEEEYWDSLVIRDIDTGEKFPMYHSTSRENSTGKGLHYNYFYIFPPTASRHFALEHELPGNKRGDTAAWDIPEVTVAANAPTMANDPVRIAAEQVAEQAALAAEQAANQLEERIANFVSDGSNDIVIRETLMYKDTDYKERIRPFTTIPRGDIVTIVRKDGNFDVLVKYKDLEGWIGSGRLKNGGDVKQ